MKKRGALIVSTLAVAILAGSLAVGTTANAAVDGDQQAALVEDYAYPGAATIQATYNVTLISGDGHLVFMATWFSPTAQHPRRGTSVFSGYARPIPLPEPAGGYVSRSSPHLRSCR